MQIQVKFEKNYNDREIVVTISLQKTSILPTPINLIFTDKIMSQHSFLNPNCHPRTELYCEPTHLTIKLFFPHNKRTEEMKTLVDNYINKIKTILGSFREFQETEIPKDFEVNVDNIIKRNET